MVICPRVGRRFVPLCPKHGLRMREIKMADNIDFSVGDKFSFFEALSTKVAAYEKSKCVQLYRRDSKTLENAKKKAPLKVDSSNKALKYYYILYSCIFGGKKFHSTSKGKRHNQR